MTPSRIVGLLALAALLACGGESRVAALPGLTTSLPPVASTAPPPTPDAKTRTDLVCNHSDVRLVAPVEVRIDCTNRPPCPMRFDFEVENCSLGDLVMKGWSVEIDGQTYGFEPEPPTKFARQSRTRLVVPDGYRALLGVYKLRVLFDSEEGTAARPALEGSFVVRDMEVERAQAECRARGGDWQQRYGHCEDVMSDADKPCNDARDCKGRCELVSETVVSPTHKRVKGTCTRHRSSLGCHTFIEQTNNGLSPRDQHFPRMCAD